jgi:hypothetical protein
MIGAPVVVGLLSDRSGPVLVASITGLLLALSDTEGPLVIRLGMTVAVAFGIAVGALLGSSLAPGEPTFWLVFFAGIFTAGLLNQIGKGPHFAVRFGAIAFAVAAGLPTMIAQAKAYWAAAVGLALVVKLIDQLVNGPLPTGAPWLGALEATRSHWLRFALAYGLAASIGLWIGVQSGSTRAVWIAAMALVMMLPNLGATYTRIVQGVTGTVLAVASIWVLTLFAPSPVVLASFILVLAFLLPSFLPRFWLFSAMVAAVVLLGWDLASTDPTLEPTLLWERLIDTLMAAGLVTALTILFFPRESWSSLLAVFGVKIERL